MLHVRLPLDEPSLERLQAIILRPKEPTVKYTVGKQGPETLMPLRHGMTGRARRAARLAFYWHSAEFALVVVLTPLTVRDYPILLVALCALAVIGWGWSLAHLPGRSL